MRRPELAERCAALPRHEWQSLETDQNRLVAGDVVEIGGGEASTSSTFAL